MNQMPDGVTTTQTSRLLTEVERGGEVVIARNGTPVARMVPVPSAEARPLRVDTWKGRVEMAADFDAPMTDEELSTWGL